MTFLPIWLRPALALALLFTLLTLLIRAQPYDDRAGRALASPGCAAPCFMRIRPGVNTMPEAVYLLTAHEWVASRFEDFPSQIRFSITFGAGLPRTLVHWRWSDARPDWIAEQPGTLLLEDREFLSIGVETRLRVGEVLLAFGRPDHEQLMASSGPAGRQFEYAGWYEGAGLLILAEGRCPPRGFYDLPVTIAFRRDAPGLDGSFTRGEVCR